MISAIASRSRPARCLTRATRSESESRAIEERISVFMTCLYHAVFRARETASDARGDARTSPESPRVREREQGPSGGPQRAFWRASGRATETAPENVSSFFSCFFSVRRLRRRPPRVLNRYWAAAIADDDLDS